MCLGLLPQHIQQLQPIQAGFRTMGVFPFNRDIFSDKDFAPSYITDGANLTPALHTHMDNAVALGGFPLRSLSPKAGPRKV